MPFGSFDFIVKVNKMYKLLLLFLFTTVSFSQSNSLEDKIYTSIDAFVAHPNEESLQRLETFEKNISPKSKSEFLALVILNCNKAYYQNQFGNVQKAIKSYEKAWQLFQKNELENYTIVESCLQPLGNLYTIIGDYDSAENTIKQYFYIANIEDNEQQKYAAVLNLSNVYQNTGRVNEAITLLEKTVKRDKLTSIQKGILLNNLGANYMLLGNGLPRKDNPFQLAEKCFLSSISLLKNDKKQSETLSNAYRNLAKIYSQQQNFDLANSNMEKASKIFISQPTIEPRKQAQLYIDIAQLNYQQRNFEETQITIQSVFKILIPNYSKAKTILPNKNQLYAETVLLDALDLQAKLFLVQNQPLKSLESYQLAFHIENLFQSLLVYENSKLINQIRNRNRTEACISINYSLYKKEKNVIYIENAFELAEATKSGILKQSVINSKTQTKDEKLIIVQLQKWNTAIIKEQKNLGNADISIINEAIRKQNELMLLLKSKEAKIFEKKVEISKLYTKLEKDNAVFVEYFFGKEQFFVFTIENSTIKIESVNNTDTATLKIVQFIDFFNNATTISNNPIAFNTFSNVAYQVLKLPKKNNHKNLIIVPDGLMTMLPFEALITERSSTTNFGKMHYLINDYAIGYANAASFYLEQKPFHKTTESVLGIFPVFAKSSLELTYSKKERDAIKSNFDGKYLSSEKATFANFKKDAGNYSILHLSTHASSGDIIEPASIKFYDQEILYSELYNLDINPDLVVLSACETGIGKLYKAEGSMSIARGFQFAGAQNLLFSLWKVNDYTTSVVMENFYKNIKKGNSYFEANHQAKLNFLADDKIPNAKKSPYYWSSFVYYGTLEKKASPNYFLYILIGICLIALFLFYRKFYETTSRHSQKRKV